MNIISMKQLRQKFGPIRKGLNRGDQYLLMYRSKPLAVIRPYAAETDKQYLQESDKVKAEVKEPEKKQTPPSETQQATADAHKDTDSTSNPLDKLGMRKAFV